MCGRQAPSSNISPFPAHSGDEDFVGVWREGRGEAVTDLKLVCPVLPKKCQYLVDQSLEQGQVDWLRRWET